MPFFSVIVLTLIPMPMFIIGAAIFGSAAREARDKCSGFSVYGIIMTVVAAMFAGGGLLWILLMAVIYKTGVGIH